MMVQLHNTSIKSNCHFLYKYEPIKRDAAMTVDDDDREGEEDVNEERPPLSPSSAQVLRDGQTQSMNKK